MIRPRSRSWSARISISVPHGGNFDGAAGVVAGLVAVAALQGLGITLDCDLTVMGIRAEESIWFQVSYIGSRGALGTLPDGALDVRRIDTGRTLAEHIADCGGDPDALRAGAASSIRRGCAPIWNCTSNRRRASWRRAARWYLHRNSRQLPLSRCADRRQQRPCRPAASFPSRCGDGGCGICHGARRLMGGA